MEPPAPPALVPLALWRPQEWRAAQHTALVTRILPLPASNKLVTAGNDGAVRVFRATDLHPLQSCAASDDAWVADATLATLGGQRRLAVSTLDRVLSFFNVLPAERDPHRPDETSCLGFAGRLGAPVAFGPATALAALPPDCSSEERLALGDQAGGVYLLNKQPPMMGKSLDLDPKTDLEKLHAGKHDGWVSALAPAAHVGLLSTSLDGSIAVVDPSTGFISSCSKALHGGAAVRCLAYHEPMTMAASGGAGRAALLWHPRGDPRHAVGELPGHEGGVVAVAAGTLGSSTHTLATISGAGAFTLWDLRTLRPLHRAENAADYARHDDFRPSAVAFDPERQRVLTAARRPCAWRWGQAAEEEEGETAFSEMPPNAAKQHIEEPEAEKDDAAAVAVVSSEVWRRAHSRLLLTPIPD